MPRDESSSPERLEKLAALLLRTTEDARLLAFSGFLLVAVAEGQCGFPNSGALDDA